MLKPLSLLSLALLLSSCSGNGWNYPAGTACDANTFVPNIPTSSATNLAANSHKLTIPDQKIDSPTHANLPDMPEGTYTFDHVDIFYVSDPTDKNESPMFIQMHDDLNNENNPKASMSMACVREEKVQHFEPQTLTMTAPTAFLVDSDGVSFTKRTFVFNFLENQLAPAPTVVDPTKYTDLSQIFTGDQKPVNWIVVNNPYGGNGNDYELRADYKCPETLLACHYTISVHMNYYAPGTTIPSTSLPQVQNPSATDTKPAPAPAAPATPPKKN